MFKPVINSIQTTGTFSAAELSLFESKLSLLSLRKNDFILKEGTICQAFYFILDGSCTHYLVSPDGTDNMINLYVKNNWFTDHKSITSQKPAATFIQAFENCELAAITIHSFHDLIQQSPAFFKTGRLLFDTVPHSDIAVSFQSPEEKYLDLLDKRPELIQKFPLKYLASYLRMAPETLSRIRRRIR